eukprot:g5130.t1
MSTCATAAIGPSGCSCICKESKDSTDYGLSVLDRPSLYRVWFIGVVTAILQAVAVAGAQSHIGLGLASERAMWQDLAEGDHDRAGSHWTTLASKLATTVVKLVSNYETILQWASDLPVDKVWNWGLARGGAILARLGLPQSVANVVAQVNGVLGTDKLPGEDLFHAGFQAVGGLVVTMVSQVQQHPEAAVAAGVCAAAGAVAYNSQIPDGALRRLFANLRKSGTCAANRFTKDIQC